METITNSGFASKIPMACFQNIKAQAHPFNVISQTDCNVLAFYTLLKQNQTKTKNIKTKKTKNPNKPEKKLKEDLKTLALFSSLLNANTCFLNCVYWERLLSELEQVENNM